MKMEKSKNKMPALIEPGIQFHIPFIILYNFEKNEWMENKGVRKMFSKLVTKEIFHGEPKEKIKGGK